MNRYLSALRLPIGLMVGNFFVVRFFAGLLPAPLGNTVFQVLRALIMVFGGWSVVSKGAGGKWAAAWAGPSLLFVEHVVLHGGLLALFAWGDEKLPLSAVVVAILFSYVLYAPVALIPGWIGGLVAVPPVVPIEPDVRSVRRAEVSDRSRTARVFRAGVLIAAACGVASAILGGPHTHAPASAPGNDIGTFIRPALATIHMVVATVAPVGLFLLWAPARGLALLDTGLSALAIWRGALSGPPLSAVLSVAHDGISAALAVASFAPSFRGSFSREPGAVRVVLISWALFTAAFVVGLILVSAFRVPPPPRP